MGFARKDDERSAPVPRVTEVPRPVRHSGFQLVGTRSTSVPPPLPRTTSVPPPLPRAARPSVAMFLAVRRSQPPPRKRRAESMRPTLQLLDLEQLAANDFAPEPRLEKLAVSNDALRESLRSLPAPASDGSRITSWVAAWFPSVEGWQSDALDWSTERAIWQRCAIGALLGMILGLALVLGAAGVVHVAHSDVVAVTLAP